MKVNLNTRCIVTLNLNGAQLWNARQKHWRIGRLALNANVGDRVEMELWRMMAVFGGVMVNGIDPPIEMDIELLIEDRK